MVMPLSEQIVDFVCSEHPENRGAWFDVGERALVDTVGVLIAGAHEQATAIVASVIDDSSGTVRSMATGRYVSERSAALVDGTCAHILDFDDVDDAFIAHPSAVIYPALFAAAQKVSATGADILAAYRVGAEVDRAIGERIGIASHYNAGWHSTSTIGTLGATAAVCHLIGLTKDQTRNALGVAGSLAAGSRQNFGTMTKPLHAGTAASNAILAARLAEQGFTADSDQLGGPLGFLALHRGAETVPPVNSVVFSGEPRGQNVKLYDCCYYTHAAIEAALAVAELLPVDFEIERVDVRVQSGGLAPLIHRRPTDGLQAKFSMEYCVAAALLDRKMTRSSFSDDAATRQDAQALLRKVDATEQNETSADGLDGAFAIVTAFLPNGASQSVRVDKPVGHATRPLSERQLRTKFTECVSSAMSGSDEVLFGLVREFRTQPSVDAVIEAISGQIVASAGAAQ